MGTHATALDLKTYIVHTDTGAYSPLSGIELRILALALRTLRSLTSCRDPLIICLVACTLGNARLHILITMESAFHQKLTFPWKGLKLPSASFNHIAAAVKFVHLLKDRFFASPQTKSFVIFKSLNLPNYKQLHKLAQRTHDFMLLCSCIPREYPGNLDLLSRTRLLIMAHIIFTQLSGET